MLFRKREIFISDPVLSDNWRVA